eukprot:CAMPEP_0172545186 /NCGR_PEP_ID=MMETSP1067-20121228/15170_1 /TAXON_ID=265564 ORGANISM="Thalassiosira punctigera, Strain Tpunct2005C2" /NCGR_SAMPLE_ID=MMETSP1067 /ASSEMBLY_ACC=CAM_ASM_000444 /LENGTH=147 /DNA_ID=CAMNT_0013331887 /DNA_START=217 /DNA_END=660 /DNA_ORIENTATION=-
MSSPEKTPEAKRQLRFSLLSVTISSVFWVWAVANTVRGGNLDLGVASFFSVLIIHAILLYYQRKSGPLSSKCPRYAVAATHLFVTLNYLLGCYIAVATELIDEGRRTRFAVYCGVATVLWLTSSFVGYKVFNPSTSDSLPTSVAERD